MAVAVQTQHHDFLYDTGPKYSSQSDSGSRIIVPYLRGAGIRQLDGMVVSHNDADHSGGMMSVLSQMPVKWLASSLPADANALYKQKHFPCFAGQSLQLDGVRFEVRHPSFDSYADAEIKDNNRSCVLHITSLYGSLLLVGDIEKLAEAELLGRGPDKLASDVLVVPHHGSKTSSTVDFITAVSPQVAIFTVGYLNRFGLPKTEILRRYQQAQSVLFRSDQDGAILLDYSASASSSESAKLSLSKLNSAEAVAPKIQVTPWRQLHSHYWHTE